MTIAPSRWEHDVQHLTYAQINRAIRCDEWQRFRVSLKGTTTGTKLVKLEWWLKYGCDHCSAATRQVQVDNYINALKRGGQLDLEGNIVK